MVYCLSKQWLFCVTVYILHLSVTFNWHRSSNFFMFEGLPETSEEGLTLELSVFESLYGGQFELSTKLIKRKSFCYTLHWSSTIVVLRNLPPFTLTFSSVNKRCLWVTVLSIRFGPFFGPLVPLRTNRLKTKFSLL